MDRPYIICHMVTSLNGKVTGEFLEKEEHRGLIDDYYRIHRTYGADGFLCGRVTMAGSFPQPPASKSAYEGVPVPREDYIAEKAAFYAVAVDPKGKLWWKGRAITDADPGYDGAHIIEVLTESVSDAFLAHLKSEGVSYLFGGKTSLDLSLVAHKLKALFGIEKLLLEGGGIVNGSFMQAGLIDEISLVVVPEAECAEDAISLFHTGKYQQTDRKAGKTFQLIESGRLGADGLWLNYQK